MNNEYLIHHLEELFKLSTWYYKFGMNHHIPKHAEKSEGYMHIRRVIHQELEVRR